MRFSGDIEDDGHYFTYGKEGQGTHVVLMAGVNQHALLGRPEKFITAEVWNVRHGEW